MTVFTNDGRTYDTDNIEATLAGALIFESDGNTIVLTLNKLDAIID